MTLTFQQALDALQPKDQLDLSLLSLLANTCETIDLQEYLPKGQDEFGAQLASARTLLEQADDSSADENPSQEDITAKVCSLHHALLALRRRPEPLSIEHLDGSQN